MTYQTIFETVMKQCHHDPDSESTLLTEVKTWINQRYERVWFELTGKDPSFARGNDNLTTVAEYTTGTVSVTNGSATVTGSGTTFTSGMVGRKFQLTTFGEVYTISAYVSATEITLADTVNADTDDELSYTIYDDEIDLPADCGEIVSLSQYMTSIRLDKIGLGALRDRQLSLITEDSEYYSDAILDPTVYAYLDDDTIIVHPRPTRQIILALDYTKTYTALSGNSDIPDLPVGSHGILVTGGMADLFEYDDDSRADKYELKFEKELQDLTYKSATKTDRPSYRPVVYRT